MLWFRWIVILWLLAWGIGYFAAVVLATQYDYWAGIYLRNPRAVDVPIEDIALFLARDVSWGLAFVILAIGIWRWNRWASWLVAALFSWFLFNGVWGLVRLVMILEIFEDPVSDWHWFLWYRGAYLLVEALILVWLLLPRVRARFVDNVPAKAA